MVFETSYNLDFDELKENIRITPLSKYPYLTEDVERSFIDSVYNWKPISNPESD